MDVSVSTSLLFFVTLISVLMFTSGGNIHRYQTSFTNSVGNPFSFISDLMKFLRNEERNLTALPFILEDMGDDINDQMKSVSDINKILDQYPDNYNNTFSKVDKINGTKVITNTTIFKSENNGSKSAMYVKEKSIDGKGKSMSAQLILHPDISGSKEKQP